jgi:hypothetical protein
MGCLIQCFIIIKVLHVVISNHDRKRQPCHHSVFLFVELAAEGVANRLGCCQTVSWWHPQKVSTGDQHSSEEEECTKTDHYVLDICALLRYYEV